MVYERFFQSKDGFLKIKIEKELQADVYADKAKLFIIDNSGSMSGTPYKQVLEGLQFIEHSADLSKNASFVLFNSTIEDVTLKQALRSRCTGCTNFVAVMKKIQQFAMNSPQDELAVVVMTDGEDTVNNNNQVNSAMQTLKFALNSLKRKKIVIHTLGFSRHHKREFLEQLAKLGSLEGVYRYVEEKELDIELNNLFDFVASTRQTELKFSTGLVKMIENVVDSQNKLDITEIVMSESEVGENISSLNEMKVMVENEEMILPRRDCDMVFELDVLYERDISSKEELDQVQAAISKINPGKFPNHLREVLWEKRFATQEKLNAFHELFANITRGGLSDASLAGQLSSLRHEARFTKARRARAMNIRVGKNSAVMAQVDERVKALPPVPRELYSDSADIRCCLSTLNVVETLDNDPADVMLFPLCVKRPEHVVDAPTMIAVEKVLTGQYSNSLITQSLLFAQQSKGVETATGGFIKPSSSQPESGKGDADSDDEAEKDGRVGYFVGTDGELMNACLPMYINDDHFARVLAQIEPILGFFFTLDPMGYKGDQYLGLFSILGQMLMRCQSEGDYFKQRTADFTMLCRGLIPRFDDYLRSGEYKNGTFGSTKEMFDRFVDSPAGRTREQFQTLYTVAGLWEVLRDQYSEKDEEKYYLAFFEECVRRSLKEQLQGLTTHQLNKLVLPLVLGPAFDTVAHGPEGPTHTVRKVCVEDVRRFELYGKYVSDQLSAKQKEKATQLFKKTKPFFKELREHEASYSTELHAQTDLPIVDNASSAEVAEYFTQHIEKLFAKTSEYMAFFAPLFKKQFDFTLNSLPSLNYKRAFMINTVFFNSFSGKCPDAYRDTFTVLEAEGMKGVCSHIVTAFKDQLALKLDAFLHDEVAHAVVPLILSLASPWAFVGALNMYCGTRGGDSFPVLVERLAAKYDDEGREIPLLKEKIGIILTGKMSLVEGGKMLTVYSLGHSWVLCPKPLAIRFKQAIGPDAFSAIEINMHGVSGHVYRMSDIPNRHGYCNSNPNPRLTFRFDGFNL